MRAIGVFLCGSLVFATGCSSSENTTSDPGPRFYDVPSPLPPGMPGELIGTTPVPSARGSRAWVMLYHSRLIKTSRYPARSWSRTVYILSTGIQWSRGPGAGRDWQTNASITVGVLGCPRQRLDRESLRAEGVRGGGDRYEGLGVPGPHPHLLGESEGAFCSRRRASGPSRRGGSSPEPSCPLRILPRGPRGVVGGLDYRDVCTGPYS